MTKYDLVLVHAPSIYDFRTQGYFYGPVSDVIPSTPVFEMYPIGFLTMASTLARRGYKVRILNLAAMMLADDSVNVEYVISSIKSRVYGIDLHWLPHAHGAIEVAKLINASHPDSKIIMGGFSATYYWEELMRNYPEIDAVFLGDSTEKPLLAYFRALDRKGAARQDALDKVPNLVHRRRRRVLNNGLRYVPDNLDDIEFDYGWMVKSVIRSMDLEGHLPYIDWKRHPMALVSTVRGCTYGCVTCMGACKSFKGNFGRERPAYRSPEKVLEDIQHVDDYLRGTIFLLGDVQQPGRKYYARLLNLIRKNRPRNEIAVEFFRPPPPDLTRMLGKALGTFDCQISPDSHDETVRKAQGRYYTNKALEASIANLQKAGANRVDVFFMMGLPKQDRKSVMDTVEFSGNLIRKFRKGGKVAPFIAPLAPFVDTGSIAFNHPDELGYTIFAKSLEEHRQLLTQPTWKHVLNYETKWLSRGELVDVTYDAGLAMNEMKFSLGQISEDAFSAVIDRTLMAREIIAIMDEALKSGSVDEAKARVRQDYVRVSESSTMDKRELDWSRKSFYWSIPRSLASILSGK